jgi:hypothetical protein
MDCCGAELHISDDYQDNNATIICQLPKGHDGPHQEVFDRDGEVKITFVCDERVENED